MDPEQDMGQVDDDMGNLNPEGGVVMSFRLQIPNPVVGSIIGKSGEIIKSIRDQSGARVIIADSQPGEDRDVTIKGNLTAVDQAVNLILTHICQVPPSPTFEMEQPDDSLSLKVLVANDQAGAIIGKGGEVIKQLREESGARISIGKKIDFVRTVSIIGNVNTVRAALAVLVRLVHAHPSSARDPFLTGYRAQPQGYRQPVGGAGMPAGYGFAPPGNPYGNGMPQAGMLDPSQPQGGMFPETNTLTLSVPHRSVGAIIGKRGQIINEIRAISGCRVDIASMTPDSQFRTITLTGTPQSIEIAHILIQKYSIQPSGQPDGGFQ
mmetsp:Transcript_37057/g.58314  ORF Transcript_37057/g.58314 Transcript_37057/m.58314 type:complete len:322 (-) Transcript_37057:156-1121(-)|eukprot:CAMPEP_0201518662 /NCGR_PEP_ID=MMETSP0161_2-20130828/9443_1 /ASSEMBLY_ACC=CAM_ASM_000251 /TAXON_ID=180227 /ORGANISM="Neoparamoeba aestuarina, Strain SoJaBio B1-5/56/2" /LENGTH=321 /DNA_ID=CAMNT_0047916495 /DNA_START=157 /DNA_END=1122 /DNA_ORIENTATION=+